MVSVFAPKAIVPPMPLTDRTVSSKPLRSKLHASNWTDFNHGSVGNHSCRAQL